MLMLTRRIGERIMIGEEITVAILGIKGRQIRIGIAAPATIAVHREEIFERNRAKELATAAELPDKVLSD